MTCDDLNRLRALAEAATPGPWYHVNPGMIVPAQRTVHGPVPTERVDYVSTWAGLGTPPGHRVVIPMPGRESNVSSANMAYIAAASPDVVLALLDRVARAEAAVAEAVRQEREDCAKVAERSANVANMLANDNVDPQISTAVRDVSAAIAAAIRALSEPQR